MNEEVRQYPEWKEAVKTFFSEKLNEPGSVISEEWKIQHFGLKRPDKGTMEDFQKFQLKLMTAFENFRKALLEDHQIHLKPIGKGAHVVLDPKEQTEEAYKQGTTDIARALSKMSTALINVDHAKLTTDERRVNADRLARAGMMIQSFKSTKRMRLPKQEPQDLLE
jgi:hypothetical protein